MFRRLTIAAVLSVALLGAVTSSAHADARLYAGGWKQLPDWGWTYTAHDVNVRWTTSTWRRYMTATITGGSALAGSWHRGGCVRVSVTGYYTGFKPWITAGESQTATQCTPYAQRYPIARLSGLTVGGYTLVRVGVRTCWSATASSAQIGCRDSTSWKY